MVVNRKTELRGALQTKEHADSLQALGEAKVDPLSETGRSMVLLMPSFRASVLQSHKESMSISQAACLAFVMVTTGH